MATTYLTRTGATPTTSNKYTFSCWVKRGSIGTTETIFRTYSDSNNSAQLIFDSDDTFAFQDIIGGTTVTNLKPSNLFRDTGAWMNFIVQVDYTQAVAADRAKIFINGVEVSYSATTVQSQNGASMLNTANNNALGSNRSNSSHYFTGSMTHANFIDGTAYPASTFGEVDSTSGIWTAKTTPSVTYGNNGFFLKMENASAMGTDSSGESNTFTVSGSLTKNQDTPNNNFATMNPLDNYYQNQTFTQGNNTVKSDNPSPVKSTLGVSSGKWYIEAKALSVVGSGSDYQIGIISSQVVGTQELGHYSNDWSYYGASGSYRNNDSFTSYGNSYTAGDIIGVAIDLDNNKLYFSKNGTFQNSGDPTSGSTGTGAISITTPSSTELGAYFLGVGGNANANKYNWNANFGNGYFGTTPVSSAGTNASGNGIFEYDVPTGYTALSTEGLNS